MVGITYTSDDVTLGEFYGRAFEEAGLPADPDRGSVELGRLATAGVDASRLFAYLGSGDHDAGLRVSAGSLVNALPHLTSATSADLVKGNHFRSSCCKAAARILFASDWAAAMEEEGRGSELSGQKIEEIAPETPDEYLEAGRFLIGAVEGANQTTIESLYDRAIAAEFPEIHDRHRAVNSEHLNPTRFAECLALESIGAGVSWTDDAAEFDIELPSIEFAMGPVHLEDFASPAP